MDLISELTPELIEEIASFSDDLTDQLNFALNVPKGDIFYDNARRKPEFWIEKIEKETFLIIPPKYSRNGATLERFYTICKIIKSGSKNVTFATMLPEIFALINIIYGDSEGIHQRAGRDAGDDIDRFFGSLVEMYTLIAFELNVDFLVNLYELTLKEGNLHCSELVLTNIFIPIADFLKTKSDVKKFEKVLELSNFYMQNETRKLFMEVFSGPSYQIPFANYEVSVEIRKAFIRQGYKDASIYYYDEDDGDSVFSFDMFTETDYYPEISQFVVENFDTDWYTRCIDNPDVMTSTPSLNFLLLILLTTNLQNDESFLEGIVLTEKTKEQYTKLVQYFNFSLVRKLKAKYPDSELLQKL